MIPEIAESVIQKNDILAISVSSMNAELDAIFNASGKQTSPNEKMLNANNGHWVNSIGEISVHFLGDVKVEGMTIRALKKQLQKDLMPYLKEPIVSIQFMNRKLTIMGEVNNPGVVYMSSDQMSLFDALVAAGDFKEFANIKDVMILRDSAMMKQIKHLNLENHELLATPWSYLQANDVVYVSKDTQQSDRDNRKRNAQSTISLVASLVSLVVIVINNLFK